MAVKEERPARTLRHIVDVRCEEVDSSGLSRYWCLYCKEELWFISYTNRWKG